MRYFGEAFGRPLSLRCRLLPAAVSSVADTVSRPVKRRGRITQATAGRFMPEKRLCSVAADVEAPATSPHPRTAEFQQPGA
jgi:hypothetical protein